MSSSEQPIIIKKRNRPNQRIREISREPEQAEASTDEKQGEGEIEIPFVADTFVFARASKF
jgi:hypothetical protein